MFLYERLFGVGLFSGILILICTMQSRYSNKKLFIGLYYVLLLVMAYCFVPHAGADLTRNILTMRAYARLSPERLINVLRQSTTPTAVLFYYIVGKIGNDHILPLAAALITIGLNFHLLNNSRKDFNSNNRIVAFVLFIFMSRGLFLQTISNIRTLMALSLVSIGVYNEFVRKSRFSKNIVFYLFAATLHTMGIVLFIYRILYMFAIKGVNVRRIVKRGSLGIILIVIALLFEQRYINALTNKALNYYDYARIGEGYSYIWEGILSALSLSLIAIIIIAYKRSNTDKRSENTNGLDAMNLVSFMLPLIIIDILSAFVEFNFYQRMSWFIHILAIPVYMKIITEIKDTKAYNSTRITVLILSIIMLVLACARGDLCSLKFFTL